MTKEKVVCINSCQIPDLQFGKVYETVSEHNAFIKLEGIKGSYQKSRFCVIDETSLEYDDLVVFVDFSGSPLSRGGFYLVNSAGDDYVCLKGFAEKFDKSSFVKIKQNSSSKNDEIRIRLAAETVYDMYSSVKHSDNDGIELVVSDSKLTKYVTYKNPKTNASYKIGDLVLLTSLDEMVIYERTDKHIKGTIVNGFCRGENRTLPLSGNQISRIV